MDKNLEQHRKTAWDVRQRSLLGQMHVGDSVYLWRSEGGRTGTGGVVAHGVLTSEPRSRIGYDYPWVRLVLDDVRLTEETGALPRTILVLDPVLAKLGVIVMARRTNYRLTSEQARTLDQLWLARKQY
jgi:hypothetical protein